MQLVDLIILDLIITRNYKGTNILKLKLMNIITFQSKLHAVSEHLEPSYSTRNDFNLYYSFDFKYSTNKNKNVDKPFLVHHSNGSNVSLISTPLAGYSKPDAIPGC